MTVTEYEGRWAVVDASGNVVAKFATNEAAWSWIDRQERRPLVENRANTVALEGRRTMKIRAALGVGGHAVDLRRPASAVGSAERGTSRGPVHAFSSPPVCRAARLSIA